MGETLHSVGIENRNGRNCYRTNYGMVRQVTEHIQRYLSGKE